uniref:Amorpha-4,11-diene synthase n=1 Tax=Cajanus cajan TaxID=3821 RepID=A0A151SUY7_CAJCA|nr:Amorpha-4,11-diene synthase [Cajanus cajan]
MVEVKWCYESYIPTYDEYKVNAVLSFTIPFFITLFIFLREFATENVLDWASRGPNIIEVASIIFDQQRIHIASIVECCMKQYDISQAHAYKLIHKDVEDCWKVINKIYFNLNDIPEPVLTTRISLITCNFSCEFFIKICRKRCSCKFFCEILFAGNTFVDNIFLRILKFAGNFPAKFPAKKIRRKVSCKKKFAGNFPAKKKSQENSQETFLRIFSQEILQEYFLRKN